MKYVYYFWNRLYHGLYCYHVSSQLFVHKILWPVIKLLYHFNRHGSSNEKLMRKREQDVISAMTNNRFSPNLMMTDTSIIALTTIIILGTINCLTNILPSLSLTSVSFISFMLISGIPAYMINHILIWRKDRYLMYFELFEQDSKTKKNIWMLITLLATISSVVFFIISFSLMKSI